MRRLSMSLLATRRFEPTRSSRATRVDEFPRYNVFRIPELNQTRFIGLRPNQGPKPMSTEMDEDD